MGRVEKRSVFYHSVSLAKLRPIPDYRRNRENACENVHSRASNIGGKRFAFPPLLPLERIRLRPRKQQTKLNGMRQVLNDIMAGKVTDELQRRGFTPDQRVRVVVESIEPDVPSITAMNAAGGGFDWLADEPDLYTDADLVERFRP